MFELTPASSAYDARQWRLDWKLIADDIRGETIKNNRYAGLPYTGQAKHLGIEFSTLQRYLSGSEPKFSIATAWLTLHTHICGYTTTQKRLAEVVERL